MVLTNQTTIISEHMINQTETIVIPQKHNPYYKRFTVAMLVIVVALILFSMMVGAFKYHYLIILIVGLTSYRNINSVFKKGANIVILNDKEFIFRPDSDYAQTISYEEISGLIDSKSRLTLQRSLANGTHKKTMIAKSLFQQDDFEAFHIHLKEKCPSAYN